MTREQLQQFLEENRELIENKDFNTLYENIKHNYNRKDALIITDLFIKSNINPLQYMTEIPQAYAYGNKNLKMVVINDDVESIPSVAFKDCVNLEFVKLPKNLKIIHQAAFENCVSLTSIKIPEGTAEIKEQAFCNCKNLREIYLPKSVNTIESLAFYISDYGVKKYKINLHYAGTEADFRKIYVERNYISNNINIIYEG